MNNYIPKLKKENFFIKNLSFFTISSLTFLSLGSIREGGFFYLFSQIDIAVLYFLIARHSKKMPLSFVATVMFLHESFNDQTYGSGFCVYLFTLFVSFKILRSKFVRNFTIFDEHGRVLYAILLSSFLMIEYCIFLQESVSVFSLLAKVFFYILFYDLFFWIEVAVRKKIVKNIRYI